MKSVSQGCTDLGRLVAKALLFERLPLIYSIQLLQLHSLKKTKCISSHAQLGTARYSQTHGTLQNCDSVTPSYVLRQIYEKSVQLVRYEMRECRSSLKWHAVFIGK